MSETNVVVDQKPRRTVGPVQEKKVILELEVCRLERELHSHLRRFDQYQENVAVAVETLKGNDQKLWDRFMLMLGLSVFINVALAIRMYFTL